LEVVPLVLLISGMKAEKAGPAAAAAALPGTETEHPVLQLLRERPGLATLAVCAVAVFLVAPIVEEFVYRVIFQGWLESEEARRTHHASPERRRTLGVVPIGLVSLVFASLHYRTAGPTLQSDFLLAVIGWGVLANLAVLVIAAWVLRRGCGATWNDFGIVPGTFWRDFAVGLIAFVAAAPLVYIAQLAAMLLLPHWLAPDPVGLFVFAVALGYIYFRTHRLGSSLAMHMALNGTSLVVWLVAR
jgi:membrane protease YdiL (CAAX protease family)